MTYIIFQHPRAVNINDSLSRDNDRSKTETLPRNIALATTERKLHRRKFQVINDHRGNEIAYILTEYRNIENLFANDHSCHLLLESLSHSQYTIPALIYLPIYLENQNIIRYIKCFIFNSRIYQAINDTYYFS